VGEHADGSHDQRIRDTPDLCGIQDDVMLLRLDRLVFDNASSASQLSVPSLLMV